MECIISKQLSTTNPQRAGGIARAEKLSPFKRRQIAKKAANARWGNE